MTAKQSDGISKGIVAPDDVRQAVSELLKEGEESAAKVTDLSVQTLARVASGLKVNRSTIGYIRSRLGMKVA